jgi:proline iminopeptidase
MTYEPMTCVETPDSTIYYELSGASSGVPLFILNGGPGFDHAYLKISSVWGELAASRPLVFYDQRGTGKSSVVKEGDPCTLANQLADLEALRAHLAFDQFDLLGHSWGGFLGMAYTARQPARVRRLVLVDSAAPRLQDTVFLFKDIFPETVERQNAVAFAVELGDDKAIRADLLAYMSMLCLSGERRDALLADVDLTTYRPYVNQTLWKDAERFDLNPELPKFRQPTLVITGRYDINVAPSVAYAIHKAIPHSRFVVFEHSGHLPFFEEPEAFTRLVEQFLSDS